MRLRRSMFYGALAWAFVASLDPVLLPWIGTGRIWWVLILQLIGLCLITSVMFWLGRHRDADRGVLVRVDLLAFTMVGVIVGAIALELGGTSGPVMPAILAVMAARGVALPERWPRGLLLTGSPLLAFLLVVFVGSLLTGTPIAPDRQVAARLAMDLALMACTLALMVAASHTGWALRRELFEARQLGRYTLRHRLGRGGMGEVWVAEHQGLRRDVALKILSEAHRDDLALRRFEREVAAMSRLAHCNTVRILDYGRTEDGFAYFAMELLRGETLADRVRKRGALPVADAIRFARDTSSALVEAHGAGVVHRDIKPENLFVSRMPAGCERIKVLDFGVAVVSSGALETTVDSAGTPLYLSPEVARGERAGPASDIYGLGCVLYFMLTGHPPFEGEHPSELLLAHAQQDPRPVGERRGATVPEGLAAIVERCLAKRPEDRFASASALERALDEELGCYERAGREAPVDDVAVLPRPASDSGPTLADLTLLA